MTHELHLVLLLLFFSRCTYLCATCVYILYICYIYIHFTHKYILTFILYVYNHKEGVREKTSCKNVKRVNPPKVWGTQDEYWRVLNKSRVLLNPVKLFVRMIIKFSYTAPGVSKDLCMYLLGKRGKCRQPAPFLRNPLLWDFCKGFTLTVSEQKGHTDPCYWSHKGSTTGISAYLTLLSRHPVGTS